MVSQADALQELVRGKERERDCCCASACAHARVQRSHLIQQDIVLRSITVLVKSLLLL